MFKMQVLVRVKHGVQEWRDVRRSNGPAYYYPTRDEAERVLRTLYSPAVNVETRVVGPEQ